MLVHEGADFLDNGAHLLALLAIERDGRGVDAATVTTYVTDVPRGLEVVYRPSPHPARHLGNVGQLLGVGEVDAELERVQPRIHAGPHALGRRYSPVRGQEHIREADFLRLRDRLRQPSAGERLADVENAQFLHPGVAHLAQQPRVHGAIHVARIRPQALDAEAAPVIAIGGQLYLDRPGRGNENAAMRGVDFGDAINPACDRHLYPKAQNSVRA